MQVIKKENQLKENNIESVKQINVVSELLKKSKKGLLLFICVILIVILVIVFVIFNKKGLIKTTVKSSLDRIVEKSDLETVNITYNVIAKKCKDDSNCDKDSNNINDFKYVVSCKGTITAGIDFSKIKIDVDEKEKKLVVTMPDASVKGEPNIGKIKFINGEDLNADELPDARKLCQETTKQKSEQDGKLLPAAKEQARSVLQEFYEQWVKAYNSEYKVEVK